MAERRPTLFWVVVLAVSFSAAVNVDATATSSVDNGVACSFESGLCGWSQDGTNGLVWSVQTGNDNTNGKGPTVDHSLRTSFGHYLYLQAIHKPTTGDKVARLVSKIITQMSPQCLSFFYILNQFGSLEIYIMTNSLGSGDGVVWIKEINHKSDWIAGQTTVQANKPYQIVIEGTMRPNASGSIAFDDIAIRNESCPHAVNNNFEQGFRLWTNPTGVDDFDWIIGQNSTPSPYTGPTSDHTFGNAQGHYAFIEGSSPRKPGDRAWLQSPLMEGSTPVCLSFWYSLYGTDIGQLNVLVLPADVPTNESIQAWTLSYNQGVPDWLLGRASVSYSLPFYIIFEAVRGNEYQSDTAIDDISVTESQCITYPSEAVPYNSNLYQLTTTTSLPTTTPVPSPYDCTFEKDFCQWIQDNTDVFDWSRNAGDTTLENTGPTVDHTLGTSHGYYAYIATSFTLHANDTARLLSPTMYSNDRGCCFRFWYHMYGPNVQSLNVFLRPYIYSNTNSQTLVWTRSGTQGDKWNFAEVDFVSDSSYQIVIEAVRGADYLGDISIDDIGFSNFRCPKNTVTACDFEGSSICGFTQDESYDNFEWSWKSGVTPTNFTGPTNDHTDGSNAGHYMYIESSLPQHSGDRARLISPAYLPTIGSCLSFYYHMYGSTMGQLNVYLAQTGGWTVQQLLFTKSGDQGNNWLLGEIEVQSSLSFRIFFDGIVGSGFYSDIAIDDFSLKKGSCQGDGGCDFENGLCTWVNRQSGDQFDWLIGKGSISNPYTWRSDDHTVGNYDGHYLYIEAARPLQPNDVAILESQIFPATAGRCFTFWFLSGSISGTVSVWLVTLPSNSNHLLWTLSGYLAQSYTYASVPINSNGWRYKLLIEGIVGSNYECNIAIDDVAFTSGTCAITPSSASPSILHTTPSFPSTATVIPDITSTPTPYDCNFESGFCVWQQATDDAFNWTRTQGPTGQLSTGPINDHTRKTGQGWYVIFDFYNAKHPNDTGRLLSPQISGSSSRCLSFYYHMFGENVYLLNVYMKNAEQTGQGSLIWKRQGTQGDQWKRATIDIHPQGPYKIIFEGVQGVSIFGDIALDDITLPVGSCSILRPTDASLTICDFESMSDPFCGFVQDKTDNFDWSLKSARLVATVRGPFVGDHTIGTQYGHYLSTEDRPLRANYTARLISKVYINPGAKQHCMHFFYHIFDNGICSLNIYIVAPNATANLSKPVWQLAYDMRNGWLQAVVPITVTSNYQVIFEGIISPLDLQGNIAIDDITITEGQCPDPAFCDFQGDTCMWSNVEDGSDQFDWIRQNGYSTSIFTGPDKDHTLQTAGGYYVFIDSHAPRKSGDTARLLSQVFPDQPGHSYCFTFWYYMYGSDVAELSIFVLTNVSNHVPTTEAKLWYMQASYGIEWQYASVNISSVYTSHPLQIAIQATIGNGYHSQVAVDDTSMKVGGCNTGPFEAVAVDIGAAECSFNDKTTCSWSQSIHDNFNWTLNNKETPAEGSGPTSDHGGKGSYLYIDSTSHNPGDFADLASSVYLFTQGPYCFHFWYHMYGPSIGTLSVLTLIDGQLTTRWTRSGTQGNKWLEGEVTVSSYTDYQIIIRATVGGHQGDIAVDDFDMHFDVCKTLALELCDFESSLCEYTPSSPNNVLWYYTTGVSNRGASRDHTTGTATGHFVAVSLNQPNTLTMLSSKTYPSSPGQCFQFYYHIHGAGSLTVGTRSFKPNTEDVNNLWTRTLDRLNDSSTYWRIGQVTLQSDSPFDIIFLATTDASQTGDISVDDISIFPYPCSEPGFCNFENGQCAYTNIAGDQFDWTRGCPNIPSEFTCPSRDHTLESEEGCYMFIDGSIFKAGDKAWLQSEILSGSSAGSHCLVFYYNMNGAGNGSLNVYLHEESAIIQIFHQVGHHGDVWLKATVDFKYSKEYYIVFEGVMGAGSSTDIAIDDISLFAGNCSQHSGVVTPVIPTTPSTRPELGCNFDHDFCKWQQDSYDQLNWTRAHGLENNNVEPKFDHTQGDIEGYYVYVDMASPRYYESAGIISPIFSSSVTFCATFWYYMYGPDVHQLSIYLLRQGQNENNIWMMSGSQGSSWLYGSIEIGAIADGQISFEASRGNGSLGVIALDDIQILNGPCPAPAFCDFEENNWCGYVQSINDQFDWILHTSYPNASLTGPAVDHTYGTMQGHYIFINTTHHQNGDVAQLYSKPYNPTDGSCLSFWYNMYGVDTATLNVYIIPVGGDLVTPAWSLIGFQGNTWRVVPLDVHSMEKFQIVFEGGAYYGGTGCLAIDDIRLDPSECLDLVDCDFEQNSICNWVQITNDDFDWMINSGMTETVSTGPTTDHTLGTSAGEYIYIESSAPQRPGEHATINSSLIPLGTPSISHFCFSFWYHMYGSTIGTLSVTYTFADLTLHPGFRASGNHGNQWIQGFLEIDNPYDSFMISATASVGNGHYGDIALDDFKLYKVPCTEVKGYVNTSTMFNCMDSANTTVSPSKVCNFVRDCPPPYQDEINCGDCDFQFDFCQWTADTSVSNLQWSRGSGQSVTSIFAPAYDYNGSPTDSFIYLNRNSGFGSDIADMYSPLLGPCSATCQLQFLYYMSGNGSLLQVGISEGMDYSVIWSLSNDQGSEWLMATVDIMHIARRFQVHVQGKGVPGASGQLALDSFEFVNCNFPTNNSCGTSQNQFKCRSSACVPIKTVCDFTDDCGDGSDEQQCDLYQARTNFEQSFDSWSQDHTGADNFDWLRRHGSTMISGTGPSRDHTRGTASGYYAYIETALSRHPGDKAWLVSIPFYPTNGYNTCILRFYYYMYGKTMGSLNIYTRNTILGALKPLLSLSGEYGDAWFREDVLLNEPAGFQVVIEAVVGNGFLSDIAVDDISMTPACAPSTMPLPSGSPPPATNASLCPTGQFFCGDNQCIPKTQVCDFLKQCADGTDELNCGTCTFESGSCGWRDHSTGVFSWYWVDAASSSNTSGPNHDADYKQNGHYMMVLLGDGMTIDRAKLISPVLQASGSTCQLKFSYYMYGPSAGSVMIMLQKASDIGSDIGVAIWEFAGNALGTWQTDSADIGLINYPFVITISSLPTLGYGLFDVAFDNIYFQNCKIGTILNGTDWSLDCTFDYGLCGFFQVRTDNFDWIRTNQSSRFEGTGPDRDHTSGHGYYVYIETSLPHWPGDVADLSSGLHPAMSSCCMCLAFWYHMFGAHVETLNVYLEQGVNKTLVWTRSNTQGNLWRQGQRSIFSPLPYKIIFEGVVGVSWQGDIALDDVSLDAGVCAPTTECDFEADFCDYTQNTNDQFDWTRHANATSTNGTGPSSDHTTRNGYGYYIYIETSAPRRQGDRAILTSTAQKPSVASQCLTFWYHMFGTHVGQLNVYVYSKIMPATANFSCQGNQANFWIQGSITVPAQKTIWLISFEGIVGQDESGDIALDDINIQPSTCPPPGSCDFEFGTCGYFNVQAMDNFDWLRTAGGTITPNTGPAVDHTTNSDTGFYMYMEASDRSTGQRTWLYSPAIGPSSHICISFWYHMYGEDEGTLRLYKVDAVHSISLVNISGDQGNLWHYWEANTSSSTYFQLTFDGTVGSGSQGDIAIDDVNVRNEVCNGPQIITTVQPQVPITAYPPTPYDCNFDQGSLCTWTQDTTDNMNWTLRHGATESVLSGPSFDHTQQNINGYYIYAAHSFPYPPNATSRIISQPLTIDTVGKCLHFWFHMYGSSIGTLNVYTLQGQKLGSPIWTRSGELDDNWHSATVYMIPQTLSTPQISSTSVQVVIEDVSNQGYFGDTAVDDISFSSGPCPATANCDFESVDICGYMQDSSDTFDWIRQKGSTSTAFTGPRTDHTYGTASGYYIYTEATGQKPGDKARLLGPKQPPTRGQCLKFFYDMNGLDIGTLSVYMLSQGTLTKLWSRSGEQGDAWRVAEVNLNANYEYQVVFEGVIGRSFTGDIAIDDVMLLNGKCPPPASCDFESDQCTWNNDLVGDDFDWERSQGSTPTSGTGPNNDHTLGNRFGHYMYIESSSPRKATEKARLHSEVLSASSASQCLVFWYYMHGAGMGTLSLYRDLMGNASGLLMIWTIYGEQGDHWNQAQINIPDSNIDFYLVFEGVVGQAGLSDIGIDDITLSPTACQSSIPSYFTCSNFKTISVDKVCNFVEECSDGKDEKNCGDCNFQQDFCGYLETSKGSFRFIRADNVTFIGSLSLPYDHTYFSPAGYMLFVDTNQGEQNALATLQSPTLRQTSPSCQLSFFYYVLGQNGGYIQVSVLTETTKTLIWSSVYLSTSNQWVNAVADIGSFASDFQILIEAQRFFSSGSVAVDDLQMTNCRYSLTRPICPSDKLRCSKSGICISPDQVCDFDNDCGPGDNSDEANCSLAHMCDFEESICEWVQDATDDFDWQRTVTTQTQTHATGPSRDHTLGLSSGHFMQVASTHRPGQKARLISRTVQSVVDADNCFLIIYYNMYGSGMGDLNVYMRTTSNGYMQNLIHRSGNLGQAWVRDYHILVSSQPFQIIIEGVVGTSSTTSMAVDDVVLSTGCKYSSSTLPTSGYPITSPRTTISPCRNNQRACTNGKCIDQSCFCDFTQDCADNSDETNCGACTFETDLCGYKDLSTGHYNWTLSYPAMMGVLGPSSSFGQYAFVGKTKGIFQHVARLQSPFLPSFSTFCLMTFYYFMRGPQAVSLQVFLITGRSSKLLYAVTGDKGPMWNKGLVNLGDKISSTPAGSQLEFHANPQTANDTNNFTIAIDGISFMYCNPKQFPPNISCNFDTSFCNWSPIGGQFLWVRNNGSTPTPGTGPNADHTKGTSAGFYAYIEASLPRQPGDTAILRTPPLPSTDSVGYCLSFWYHMFGANIGNLTLSLTQPVHSQIFWSKQGAQGDRWKMASRTIVSDLEYFFSFEASVGHGSLGDIAIDDISTKPGPCPRSSDCSFEDDLCNWSPSTTDIFNWTLGSNGSVSLGTGPNLDHTFGSNTGHFLYFHSSQQHPGDKASLISSYYNRSTKAVAGLFCLHFWYFMSGLGTGSLVVSAFIDGTSVPVHLWDLQGDQGNEWRRASVTYYNSKPFRLMIIGTQGNGTSGNIAIDDITVLDSACPLPGSCSFETDTCGYINTLQGDDFDWQRDNGITVTMSTGPSFDHTKGTAVGYYMYSETSLYGNTAGVKAWLISETLKPPTSSTGGCLTFFYHMYGIGVGSLNVYIHPMSKSNKSLIWTLSGNQGNMWKSGRALIHASEMYEIVFEAVYGGNITGYIAIDDINVSTTRCYSLTTVTVPPTTATSPAVYPVTEVDCDFESALCNWQQDGPPDDQFDWNLQSGTTQSENTGPSADHTYGTLQGHYIFAQAATHLANTSARLISPTLSIRMEGACFKFWYFMFGSSINRLNLWIKDISTSALKQIWTRSGDQGLQWRFAQVHIQTVDQVFFILEALAGSGPDGDIAVDDITFNTGHCPVEVLCDFEDLDCGYTQDFTDNFDWTRHSGTTSTLNTGPPADHTFGTLQGHYMYIESSAPQKPGDKARLDSPQLNPTTGSCLQFWYNMHGNTMGTLNVYLRQDSLDEPIWIRSGEQGTDWIVGQVTLQSAVPFRFTFEGVVGSGVNSDIGIDDIIVKSGACLGLGSCDFEDSFCGWMNAQTGDDFDWLQGRSYLLSGFFGPVLDHTLNTAYGVYMYINSASPPRKRGDRAQFISPVFDNSAAYCLIFWYRMMNPGQLNINIKLVTGTVISLSNITKIQEDWQIVRVTIDKIISNYKIVIERDIMQPGFSDVAIDDISVPNGKCESLPTLAPQQCAFTCSNSTCIPRSKVCDFLADCANGEEEIACGYNCNFDNNVCRWQNRAPGAYQWTKFRGATPDSNTGPSVDHTLNSFAGYYMFVDANNAKIYSQAFFDSPLLQSSAPSCQFSFWFHMYGTGVGQLYVYKREGTESTPLWYTQGDHGNRWYQITIPIGRMFSPFSMSIAAVKTVNVLGDIAIDDINFQNCNYPAFSACSALKKFRCANQNCISTEDVCDFVDDCGDSTDEQDYTCSSYQRCDFENNMCNWNQDSTDDFDWIRQSGGTPTSNTGPSFDHTTGTKTGHFVYIESSAPRKEGDVARLIGPILQPSSKVPFCRLKLFYHMYGANVGSIVVYTRNSLLGSPFKWYSRTGEVGNYWTSSVVYLYNTRPFQVVIEATVGQGYLGDIGIDDIILSPECIIYNGVFPTGSAIISTVHPVPCHNSSLWQCADTSQCISRTHVCDFITQCNDKSDEVACGACTFEQGMCGWQDISTGKYVWELHNGTTPSPMSGPSTDHTTGTSAGKYIYVDSTVSNAIGRSLLLSPAFGSIGAGCEIRFWVHKNLVGGLILKLLPPGNDAISINNIIIWQITEALGNKWTNASAGINARPPGYRLIFEVTNSVNSGDVTIDDISFSPTCAYGTSMASCATDQFHCSSGICVDQSKLCDFSNDCGDNSDEAQCSSYVEHCNFEKDLCNWIQDQTDVFDWTRKSGTTTTIGTGPDRDHTYGTESGFYLYIESSSPRKANDTARILSPVFMPVSDGTCTLRFFYHMFGNDINSLNVYLETSQTGLKSLLYSVRGQQGDVWRKAMINLISDRNFRVVIEEATGSGEQGDIGLDDTSFTPGCHLATRQTLPPVIPTKGGMCPAGQFMCGATCRSTNIICDFTNDCPDGSDELHCPSVCSFENGNMCGWSNQALDNSANWILTGPTGTNTPLVDHNPGNTSGHFALVSFQYNVVNSHLVSQVYHTSGPACPFTFWYMYNVTGSISISLFVRSGSNDQRIWMFSSVAPTMNVWHNVTALLPSCSSEFQLVIQVQTSGYSKGYVAIDDLSFKNCGIDSRVLVHYCDPRINFQCKNGLCISQDQVCNLQSDCCDGSDESPSQCYQYRMEDFEQGLGGFIQQTDDNFNWSRHRGPTFSQNIGLSQDHTTGSASGYYMYIETSAPQEPGDKAQLAYNLPAPTGQCSMRFWYHMYQAQFGSINIYTHDATGKTVSYLSLSHDHGNKWLLGEANFSVSVPFQVIIEGVVAVSYLSDIAIDDVTFTPGCNLGSSTPPPTPSPSAGFISTSSSSYCGSGLFRCNISAECIPASQKCDFSTDCTDRSDETSCFTIGNCDFSSNFCGWTEAVVDLVDWKRVTPVAIANRDSPPLTDADGATKGYFLYLFDSSSSGFVDHYRQVDELRSAQYSSAGAQCKIQFSYYLQGSNPGALTLSILGSLVNDVVWQSDGTTNSKWVIQIVSIGRRSGPFSLMFSLMDVPDMSGSVALDNIKFLDCQLPLPQTSCAAGMFQCKNTGCIDSNSVCDLTDDCGDQSDELIPDCVNYKKFSFENIPYFGDFAQGASDVDDTQDWKWYNHSYDPGLPAVDHTTGTDKGHYLYLWTDTRSQTGDTAWIISKPLTASTDSSNICTIRFYYFITGSSSHTLSINYRTHSSGPGDAVLKSIVGSEGAFWQQAIVPVLLEQPFQLIIEVSLAGGQYGVAIDDVSLTPGCIYTSQPLPSVGPSTPQPSCTSSQFQCNSTKTCIDLNRRCDSLVDCLDSSDEIGCGCTSNSFHCSNGMCISAAKKCDAANDCGDNTDETDASCSAFKRFNFEGANFGDFTQGKTGVEDQTDWRLGTSGSQQGIGLPSFDHTNGKSSGHFVYAQAQSIGNSAWLISKTFAATSGKHCQMRFYFYIPGSGSRLLVKFRTHRAGPVDGRLWTNEGQQSARWLLSSTNISVSVSFQIIIEAYLSFLGTSVSVDDISFSPDCQYDNQALPLPPTYSSTSPIISFTTLVKNYTSSGATPVMKSTTLHVTNSSNCAANQLLCTDHQSCYATSKHCDGIKDCKDGSDETPENCTCSLQCKNGGSCIIVLTVGPQCSCPSAFSGSNCEKSARVAAKDNNSSDSKKWSIPLGIILGLLALEVMVVAFVHLYKKDKLPFHLRIPFRRRNSSSSDREELANSVFDYSSGGTLIHMGEMDQPTFVLESARTPGDDQDVPGSSVNSLHSSA